MICRGDEVPVGSYVKAVFAPGVSRGQLGDFQPDRPAKVVWFNGLKIYKHRQFMTSTHADLYYKVVFR